MWPRPASTAIGLMRNNPERAAPDLVHLHGETHRGIDRLDAARLEFGHDGGADLVDLLARSMELQVGHGSRRTPHRLARHTDHEAQQRHGPGVVSQNLVTLGIERRAREFNQPNIIRSALHGETA